MHFTEEQTGLLKTWVIKKLEDISDADADVLADYALALVSTEDGEDVARANCIENLRDFLPNNAEQFVNELFKAIATKSYDPSQPKRKPAPPVPQIPTGPKNDGLGAMNESRKRSFQWDGNETFGQNGQFQGGTRPIKQLRRSGKGGFERGGRQQQGPMPQFAPQQSPQHFPQPPHMGNFPPPPQNLPAFDPNDPMVMFALQQFMGAMAGNPNAGSPPNGLPFRPPGPAQRCRDYDMKGFCAAGGSCPYEHGNDGFVFPPQSQEYDPANAMLNVAPNRNGHANSVNSRSRGGMRGRGRGTNNFRGGGKRSDFSKPGPNRDSTNTSVVVEQIPDDRLDEHSVRDFFSEFGGIEEVTMHVDRKLAIVKYEDKAGAKAAYESPKVVFDNRFVKVYWYHAEKFEQQHDGLPATKSEDVDMRDDQQEIDRAELAKRQEEAQRKHEEARKQREETEQQKASLDQKLKAMEAERKKMADLLAKKSGKAVSPSPTQNGDGEENEQTKGLRAQLAKLEAEAKELGIDPDATFTNGYDSFSSPPYRGRGGFRGRVRGRGHYQPHRGHRGGHTTRGGAVMRLDNRPKTIAVTFTNNRSYDANDEALRQFLLFNSMETGSITKHPDKDDTALLAFHQRYEGENFMVAARGEIPHAGKVEASWYAGAMPANVQTEVDMNGAQSNGWADVKMESQSDAGEGEGYDSGDREEQDLDRFA